MDHDEDEGGGHGGDERWLISYADFITLLFAFFVVMFVSSQADKGKAQQVSESVKKALEGEKMGALIAAVLGGTVDNRGQGNAEMHGPGGEKRLTPDKPENREGKLAELMPSLQVLSSELKTEIDAGRIQISMEPRGLVVSFKQAALFPPGDDAISPDALPSLGKIAAAIARIPNPVRLEGHTDSRKISTARFHSNWDLSAVPKIVESLRHSCASDRLHFLEHRVSPETLQLAFSATPGRHPTKSLIFST